MENVALLEEQALIEANKLVRYPICVYMCVCISDEMKYNNKKSSFVAFKVLFIDCFIYSKGVQKIPRDKEKSNVLQSADRGGSLAARRAKTGSAQLRASQDEWRGQREPREAEGRIRQEFKTW